MIFRDLEVLLVLNIEYGTHLLIFRFIAAWNKYCGYHII